MHQLVAVPAVGGTRFVDTLLSVWDAGDALAPLDPRLPPPAREALLAALAPSVVLDERGEVAERREGVPIEYGDALVVPTSGMTGAPKGVVHTHEGVAASAHAVNTALEVDPAGDGWLCCLPLAHIAGLAVVARALAAGTRLEVLERFDPSVVEAAAAERGATLTSLVPTALGRTDVSGFRWVVVGGSTPPDDPPPNVVASYGMTETGSAVVLDGEALPTVELDVRDGEVWVRGPMLLRCYRDGTVPVDADGWLATGDAGELDADGLLVVHGRRGDLIITGGVNVYPLEVEQVLREHPDVVDVAVYGVDDPTWGRRVCAAVVGAADEQELAAWCRDRLAPPKRPKTWLVTDDLPRTLTGKVRRDLLAERTTT